MKLIAPLKERAKQLKNETYSLYLAYRDPRVPWYAKLFLAAIVGYSLSPVDLIPDFIPVLGYIDDLIIIPAGIFLTLKMVPRDVLEEYRQKAGTEPVSSRVKWVAAAIVIAVWLLVIYLLIRFIWGLVS